MASSRIQEQSQAAAALPGTKRVVESAVPPLGMPETSYPGPDGLGLIQFKATI